ncbi:MAG: methylenetetrahydrofolate reductase [NAD(P)H] [Hyphomicrobiales bacterium]
MKIIDQLNNINETKFSFELLPPPKGSHIQLVYKTIDELMEFKPIYINMTYHQEEIVYKERNDGLLKARKVMKRPGTVGISAAIQYKYNVPVVPHIICGSFSREDTENALIDLNFLGIDNILVLRGDPPMGQKKFIPHRDGHQHALGLIQQVMNLNNGIYLDDDMKITTKTNFSIGVAGYPEKHIESPNLETDLKHLKAKIDAGADYIVTQMFFDNKKYFDFVNACRNIGINVPIIPGLKPIAIKEHLNILPKTFNIDLPLELVKELEKCKTNKDVNQLGVEWCVMQSKELIDHNVSNIHYYTMDKATNITKIAKEVF